MRIVKALGAIFGVLLLALVVPVLIGMIGRSALAIFALLGVAVVVMLFKWWRNISIAGGKSRFFRQRERGAFQKRQRLSQDDAMRQRSDTD
jgi:hypothetical protein